MLGMAPACSTHNDAAAEAQDLGLAREVQLDLVLLVAGLVDARVVVGLAGVEVEVGDAGLVEDAFVGIVKSKTINTLHI